jgi:hypothetical protein
MPNVIEIGMAMLKLGKARHAFYSSQNQNTGCLQRNTLILMYSVSTKKRLDFLNVLKIVKSFFQVLRSPVYYGSSNSRLTFWVTSRAIVYTNVVHREVY